MLPIIVNNQRIFKLFFQILDTFFNYPFFYFPLPGTFSPERSDSCRRAIFWPGTISAIGVIPAHGLFPRVRIFPAGEITLSGTLSHCSCGFPTRGKHALRHFISLQPEPFPERSSVPARIFQRTWSSCHGPESWNANLWSIRTSRQGAQTL